MPVRYIALALLLLLPTLAHAADRSSLIRTDPAGRYAVTPAPVPDALRNPWPADLEAAFAARADKILRGLVQAKPGNNTYFENEKRTYGVLMAHVLAGQSDVALKMLQNEDAQNKEWHRETAGIDYYACFTLKHQMRKYFYFGPLLEESYKQRMFDGARAWSEQDPLRRPHYAFKKSGPGWGPDVMNSWVDVRSTENLFLMRVTSVYLMAEETRNAATRDKYKRILLDYAAALYRVGMGEWDSENYHGHSIAPLLNLYDFAKDEDVKRAAKAALDFVCATGAVKYYRGGFNGPTKRDYNHPQPFGGSAASNLWVYFGDAPDDAHHWESDEIHMITSGYRPPLAVVNLALKKFPRPAEILASKAHYEASVSNHLDRGPQYLETQYVGQTFQLGSLISGTSAGKSDVNGFKIMAFDGVRGVADFQCVPGPDPAFVGSPKYAEGKVAGFNRVAQNRNAAVWLVHGGDSPWVWVVPGTVQVETENSVTFLRAEQTWIALHPLGLAAPVKASPELTAQLHASKDGGKQWVKHQVLWAKGDNAAPFCGQAIEVGEGVDYAEFKKAVLAKAKTDVTKLSEGQVSYTTSDGHTVALKAAEDPAKTEVMKDGKPHDPAAHARQLFGGAASPIRHDWLGGTLTVTTDGAAFTGTVDQSGKATFGNR